jgi:hypothetical protein
MDAHRISIESAVRERASFIDPISMKDLATVGTFAGSKDAVIRIRDGKPIAANTGDQGGRQN